MSIVLRNELLDSEPFPKFHLNQYVLVFSSIFASHCLHTYSKRWRHGYLSLIIRYLSFTGSSFFLYGTMYIYLLEALDMRDVIVFHMVVPLTVRQLRRMFICWSFKFTPCNWFYKLTHSYCCRRMLTQNHFVGLLISSLACQLLVVLFSLESVTPGSSEDPAIRSYVPKKILRSKCKILSRICKLELVD